MQSKKPINNIRKCVICYQHKSKDQFLRFVYLRPQNRIVVDDKHNLHGRGYYICMDSDHLKALQKYKVLNKILRCEVSPSNYDKLIVFFKSI